MKDRPSSNFGFIRLPAGPATDQKARLQSEISQVSVAKSDEAQIVTEIVTDAFLTDPVWSWVFPKRAIQRRYWQLFINGALRYPHTYHTGNYEAVSVWIPPDMSAFLPQDSENFATIIESMTGPRTGEVMEFLQKFDAFHPRDTPHYYLGLLAVQNQHRGRGIGMELLKENLMRFDHEGAAAYLESSNQANNRKYESLGFSPVMEFRAYDTGPSVTGMWRGPR
jgi:ribosomal protein S18 acetylase RimI-like enzyme